MFDVSSRHKELLRNHHGERWIISSFFLVKYRCYLHATLWYLTKSGLPPPEVFVKSGCPPNILKIQYT